MASDSAVGTAAQELQDTLDALYMTIGIAVALIVIMVAVTWYYKKHVLDPAKPASGGFMAGVFDETSGAHMEGDTLVLWTRFGGSRYPMNRADGPSVETGSGSYRLVYQPFNARGRRTSPMMVSADTVDRELALKVCSCTELTGNLSVYTPDRQDAQVLMSEATGGRTLDFSFTGDLMSCDFRSMRRRTPPGHRGTYGPMCLYGGILGDADDESAPGHAERSMDMAMGFHGTEAGSIFLSSDLGGIEIGQGATDSDDPLDGFRIMVLIPEKKSLFVSKDQIPHEVALTICSDPIRQGILNVYVQSEGKARILMTEAVGGEPRRMTGPKGGIPEGMGCYADGSRGTDSPKAFFGPIPTSAGEES